MRIKPIDQIQATSKHKQVNAKHSFEIKQAQIYSCKIKQQLPKYKNRKLNYFEPIMKINVNKTNQTQTRSIETEQTLSMQADTFEIIRNRTHLWKPNQPQT